jgi:hypothetical protein
LIELPPVVGPRILRLDRRGPGSVHRVESKRAREVHVSIVRKLAIVLFSAAVFSAPVRAQDWSVGASIGLTNDVNHRVRVSGFDPSDASAWVDFQLEERALLRGTIGSIKTKGSNAGLLADIDGEEVELPDLKARIDYVNVGVSYQFWEGDYTSGIFGGIGGYKIDPERVAPEFEGFEDPEETVFGLHVGIDGDLRVISRLSLVGRITLHKIFSERNRLLLTANAGLAFRF